VNKIAEYIVPVVILLVFFAGLRKGGNIFSQFTEGAADGLKIAARILPVLMGLILAVSALKASGAIDVLLMPLRPLLLKLGVPEEILPLALLRPISGSGSLALLNDVIQKTGPDSKASKIGATLLASTETTLYTIAMYFGSVKIKKYRYTVAAALLCDISACILSVIFINLLHI
jgi:spore maturation protein B